MLICDFKKVLRIDNETREIAKDSLQIRRIGSGICLKVSWALILLASKRFLNRHTRNMWAMYIYVRILFRQIDYDITSSNGY